jgi:hypothetical protein
MLDSIIIFGIFFILIILCTILYLLGKLKSDLEYAMEVSEKQNEFIQDRLCVLEIKIDNSVNSSEDMIFNIARGKQ